MALVKVFRIIIAASLLAVAVSGCNGGGDDSSGGGGDDSSQGLLTPAPSHHRHVDAASGTAAVASPSPSPSTMLSYSSYLRQNVAFDSRRSQGMTQVYEGKTLTAVSTFHDAQHMHPEDETCKLWLAAIKKAASKPRDHALVLLTPHGADEFQNSGQAPGGMPQPPAVPQSGAAAKPLSVDPRQVF